MKKIIAFKKEDLRQAESVFDPIIGLWIEMEKLTTEEKRQQAMDIIVGRAARGES